MRTFGKHEIKRRQKVRNRENQWTRKYIAFKVNIPIKSAIQGPSFTTSLFIRCSEKMNACGRYMVHYTVLSVSKCQPPTHTSHTKTRQHLDEDWCTESRDIRRTSRESFPSPSTTVTQYAWRSHTQTTQHPLSNGKTAAKNSRTRGRTYHTEWHPSHQSPGIWPHYRETTQKTAQEGSPSDHTNI
jgi:hypothetical protein